MPKNGLKKGLIALSVGLCVTVFVSACNSTLHFKAEAEKKKATQTEAPPMPDLLAVGTEAPPFTLQTLEGKTYSLKEFQGKKMVLIEFFSTGCPHCHASVPFLQFIAENFSDTVQLLAINSADQPGQPSTTPEFRDHYKTRFPILEIPNQELLTNYHLRGFPTSYLIDTDGKIIWVHEGVYSNVTMIQLEKALYPNEKPEAFAKATTEAPHPAKN